MDELREKIARAVQEQLWADPDGASETFQHDVADRILAIPEIAEAQERIKELESNLEAWQYAAQYPEG